MGKRNNHRRRRLTPCLKLSRERSRINHSSGATGPTSPPETPTGSPHMARKPPQHSAVYFGYSGRPLEQDPNIKPVGHGHQFSYRRVIGPEQLSPRSSSSDESEGEQEQAGEELDDDSSVSDIVRPQSIINSTAASSEDAYSGPDEASGDGDDEHDDDDDDDGDDDGDDGVCRVGEEDYDEAGEEEEHVQINARPYFRLPSQSESVSISAAGSEAGDEAARQSRAAAAPSSATSSCGFTVEDVDPMDSGCEGLEVLLPTEIESNRSRSRSRHKYFDKGMVRDFKNLNCSNDVSENEVDAEGELGMDTERVFLKKQKEMRRIRRVSMSSTGKRTHSEFSEFTDSDNSDTGGLDVNEVGSSARKLRKRLHRGSLLFQDPPAPRIDELDEPDSSENEYDAADPLARELPYWTMKTMETMEILEVESP
ncbi:hypothetical protein J3459_007926 [Metarhizium acridum]|uniref:Uncharacterized protein n=1 Tax=Metarhizium acridum (strain CQMa 102) TaxID=655827 RepID=E9DWC9_METAQ|nr:uncharacterized protein MAC_01927 [Metarhizium acridum CQMa 102]EFY91979.1 hypothetical protein MAC_01927 [Metarhizium acridum CQMa 102]KAG8409860.1 hypothetical protein J3458_018942 [Metarhizium acridum]KAG8426655.1 hypothetical protein J3459_007926 [Metarhizium acridum]